MKKVLIHTIFLFTCFYFFTGGNLALFSKLGKGVQTEVFNMDEDAPDTEGKEAKGCKEDGCDEESYLENLHAALFPQNKDLSPGNFLDPDQFISKHILDKSSPPPRA